LNHYKIPITIEPLRLQIHWRPLDFIIFAILAVLLSFQVILASELSDVERAIHELKTEGVMQ